MSRSAMRRRPVNYAGDRALRSDARPVAQCESLQVRPTELLKEVTV